MLKAIFRLPATVWLVGFISLFNDSASELIYPLVPLYVASVLMAGPKALGIIDGVAETAASLLKLFSGMIADKSRSTKSWVVGGYALAAMSRPLLALAASWPTVMALRFADRVGKGVRAAPRDAMLAMAVTSSQRGLAFGFHRAMDNAGAVIGPLSAAWLLERHMPIRDIFLWAAIPGMIVVALALFIHEPQRDGVESRPKFSWTLTGFPSSFRRYLLVLLLFTLGNSSNMFLLLRAKEMGLSDYQVPLLWALVAFTATLFSVPLSALSDRVGRTRLIVTGWGIYGLFYLFLGLNGGYPWLLWPLFAFYGLFMAATEGAEKALVADIAPTGMLGTAYGWYNLTTGIMLLPSSVLFGWLWETFNPGTAFGFAAGCAVTAAGLLKFWVAPRRHTA
jgi:MFS family permease